MRCLVLLAIAATCAVAATPAAARASGPALRVEPATVAFGQTLHVRGRHWPVIEFCRPRVRIRLRSDQNAFTIATVRIRPSGRWSLSWVPRRSQVGAGTWRLVARQACESGDDGSPNPVRRTAEIRIRR